MEHTGRGRATPASPAPRGDASLGTPPATPPGVSNADEGLPAQKEKSREEIVAFLTDGVQAHVGEDVLREIRESLMRMNGREIDILLTAPDKVCLIAAKVTDKLRRVALDATSQLTVSLEESVKKLKNAEDKLGRGR